jgi:hypothetical protein
MVIGRTPLPALYWLTGKVVGPGVQVGYNRGTYLKSVTTLYCDLRTAWRCDRRLDVHSKSSDKVVWRNLLEGLWDHRSGLLGPLSGL